MLAYADIHRLGRWIPAFAGMTCSTLHLIHFLFVIMSSQLSTRLSLPARNVDLVGAFREHPLQDPGIGKLDLLVRRALRFGPCRQIRYAVVDRHDLVLRK